MNKKIHFSEFFHGVTCVFDAAQVVDDVVKCRVCLLTCLESRNSALSVSYISQNSRAKRFLLVLF